MDNENNVDVMRMKLVLDTSEAEEAINKVKAKLFELANVLEKANSLRDELASGEIDLNLSFDVQS